MEYIDDGEEPAAQEIESVFSEVDTRSGSMACHNVRCFRRSGS